MLKNNLECFPYTSNRTMPTGRTLIFAPHPDDEILGCGGALIRHVQQNDTIKVIVVTDGSFPMVEEQIFPDYPEIRRSESIAAAKLIGYDNPVFLNFPDNSLKLNKNLIAAIKKEIEIFKPVNIYLPHYLESHPDHRIVNKAVIKALHKIQKIKVKYLISYEISNPLMVNYLHDITDISHILEQAVNCFKSQLKINDYKTKIMALNKYRTYTLPKEIMFAEAYNVKEIKTWNFFL